MGEKVWPRFTKDVVQGILDKSDGCKVSTYSSGKNYSYSYIYEVRNGKMYQRVTGRNSWSDSRSDKEYEMSIDEARRIIKEHPDSFNLSDYGL